MEAERLIKMIDGIDYSSEYSDDEDIRVNLNDLVDIRESQEFMEGGMISAVGGMTTRRPDSLTSAMVSATRAVS